MPTSEESEASNGTFCVLAFNHLQVAPNGTVKMCCIAEGDISDEGRAMSLYSDSYEQIWNSRYMRDARRGMAEGEKISPCMRCYREEDAVGQSRRTIQNAVWLKELQKTPDDFLNRARERDWKVSERPGFLQLNLGNLCNLACRMCSSQYSSRIEHDPVHSKWMPAAWPDAARWRGKRLHFGPRPFFGVTYDGFHAYDPGSRLRWSTGTGSIRFDIPAGEKLSGLGLTLRTMGNQLPVELRVNGLTVFDGEASSEWTRSFELRGLSNQSEFTLEILTPSVTVGGRPHGVALLDAWVERTGEALQQRGNERTLHRLSGGGGWWENEHVMFDEILGDPQTLRYIIFQGGEPFLVKEFERILDKLIASGVASNITFEIVSNLTVLTDSLLEKLSKLRQLLLCASIDGIGDVLEYIRYPAKWADIEANLRRVRVLNNLTLSFSTAVQAYNLTDVVNIFSYCDKNGIDLHTHFLVGPAHLNVAVLPRKVRQLVIAALEAYVSGSKPRPTNRASAEYMIRFLKEHLDTQYRDQFSSFVKFTNDMDIPRGQNFRGAFRELVQWLAEDGLRWTNETAFANRPAPSMPGKSHNDTVKKLLRRALGVRAPS